MDIVAIIVICLLGAILLIMSGIVLACLLLFKLSFSRKSYAASITRKVTLANAEKYKIDYSWWEREQEVLTIESFDGLKLCGYFLDGKSDKLAILSHGYGGEHRDLNVFAEMFLKRGYSVLAVDARAHGNSEGNMIGMGWLDRLDIKKWIDFMLERNKNYKIVLFGQSMGASATCMTVGENLPNNVVCAISDCAYDNVYRELYFVGKSTFRFLTKPLLNMFSAYMKRGYSFDLKQADAIKQLKNCKIPVLFFHGKDDTFVPVEMCHRLSEAIPQTRREVMIVDGANHILSYPLAPKEYMHKIDRFLSKYNM